MTIQEKDGWLIDGNNNRAYVGSFGTKEEAQKALESLKNCRNCINCRDCSDCSGCEGCSDCSYCLSCVNSLHCSYCSYCVDCYRCSHCSDCFVCSGGSGKIGDLAPPPETVRTRPAPRLLRFLASMAQGVAVLLIFAGLWTALALFINATNGGL